MQKRYFGFAAAMIVLATSASISTPSNAQSPDAQVGMILFPVQRDQNNRQYIISRMGYKLDIQGVGIAKDAKQIAVYQDNQNNYWYINKKGQPTPVNQTQMAKLSAQIQAQQVNNANPNPNPNQNQNVTINNQAPASSGGGSSALGTGLAAMGGAMGGAAIGAAMTNSAYSHPYYGVPYGQPIYKAPSSGNYYYKGSSGNNVVVAPTKQTNAMFNQYNQQGAWKDKNQWANNPNWNNNINHGNHPGQMPAASTHPAQGAGGRKFGSKLEAGGAAAGGRRVGRFR
jgi:hypothetical protein